MRDIVTTLTCDRCKKVVDNLKVVFAVESDLLPWDQKPVGDICKDCRYDLDLFLAGGEIANKMTAIADKCHRDGQKISLQQLFSAQ